MMKTSKDSSNSTLQKAESVRLSALEIRHLVKLHTQMASARNEIQGALNMILVQRELIGNYSLSEDCSTLVQVDQIPPPGLS